MNTMPFASQNTEAITFPVDDTTLAFFGAGEVECFHCMDCLLVSGSNQSDGPNIHVG